MKARDALIAWTPMAFDNLPTVGQVAVGPLLQEGDADWAKPYRFTGGAAHVATRKPRSHASTKMVFVEFNTLVVRDGLDPQVVHKAFLAIDEYALTISPDTPGARFEDDE